MEIVLWSLEMAEKVYSKCRQTIANDDKYKICDVHNIMVGRYMNVRNNLRQLSSQVGGGEGWEKVMFVLLSVCRIGTHRKPKK